jgi:hypothetical protein
MSAFRSSIAALLLAGCAARLPAPAELTPVEPGRAARAVLPDEMERAASRALAMAFADRADHAALAVGLMRDADARRREQGMAPAGLADWAADAAVAAGGVRAYLSYAERQLEHSDLDPALRARMERVLAQQPLAVAERALADERRARWASALNRVSAPLTRLALGGGLSAIETGQAALRSLLLVHHFPRASARERRALRAYRELLARQPDGPQAAEARAGVERLSAKLARARAGAALDAARAALARGQTGAALAFVARGERAAPGMRELAELRREALAQRAAREAELRRAYAVHPAAADRLEKRRAQLAAAALAAPPDELARRTADAAASGAIVLAEQRFLEALALRAPGQDDAFLDALGEVAELPGPNPMARHAAHVLADSEQNPYRAYRRALREQRGALLRWVMLGRLARGPAERGLPRPLEYALDSLALPVVVVSMPLRLLALPAARARASPPILRAGERYLARYPQGAHAARLHRDLESRSARAGLPARALEHNRARGGRARRAARYREQLAAGLLDAANRERRPDMRAAVYAELLGRYGDTRSAERGRRELGDLLRESSPQQIRLSRAFLLEHPALVAPDALALRAELVDGEEDNGEMGEEGVTLLGGRFVRVALEEREPKIEAVPAANLARLAALLDETAYRALAGDARERPDPDPQRDSFLERARLQLLDAPDRRPSARSEAEYLSSREKHGWMPRRESILPFEVVVQGDLETLGLGAAPRLRLPDPGADAFLYE